MVHEHNELRHISNEEQWFNTLHIIKEFMDNFNRKPSYHSENDEEKRMGKWIINQQGKCKNREQLMKSDEIYNKWIEFTNEYSQYFKNQ